MRDMRHNVYYLLNLAFGKISDLHIAGQNFRSDVGAVEGSLLLKNREYHHIATIKASVDLERNVLTLRSQQSQIVVPRGAAIPPLQVDISTLGENQAQEQIVAFVRAHAESYGLLEPVPEPDPEKK